VASVANVVPHFVETMQEVVPKCVDLQSLFKYLCNSFDEDGMPLISLCPFTSFLHMSHSTSISAYSQYFSQDIPFVQNVLDYFRAMSFVVHASSKLRDLNYDNFWVENVHCIPTTFNDDFLFEPPPHC
jgi:hypothetical protein